MLLAAAILLALAVGDTLAASDPSMAKKEEVSLEQAINVTDSSGFKNQSTSREDLKSLKEDPKVKGSNTTETRIDLAQLKKPEEPTTKVGDIETQTTNSSTPKVDNQTVKHSGVEISFRRAELKDEGEIAERVYKFPETSLDITPSSRPYINSDSPLMRKIIPHVDQMKSTGRNFDNGILSQAHSLSTFSLPDHAPCRSCNQYNPLGDSSNWFSNILHNIPAFEIIVVPLPNTGHGCPSCAPSHAQRSSSLIDEPYPPNPEPCYSNCHNSALSPVETYYETQEQAITLPQSKLPPHIIPEPLITEDKSETACIYENRRSNFGETGINPTYYDVKNPVVLDNSNLMYLPEGPFDSPQQPIFPNDLDESQFGSFNLLPSDVIPQIQLPLYPTKYQIPPIYADPVNPVVLQPPQTVNFPSPTKPCLCQENPTVKETPCDNNRKPLFPTNDVSYFPPPGYQYIDGLGYYMVNTKRKNWEASRKACAMEGGNLLVINSDRESQAIAQLLHQQFGRQQVLAFAGFHDKFREGDYISVSGKPLLAEGWIKWSYNQPDNHSSSIIDPSGEDCGAVNSDGFYEDVHCDFNLFSICEIPLVKAVFY